VVSQVTDFTPRHALTDFLRSLGCSEDEIEPIGEDQVAWRGAVYTAVSTTDTASRTRSQSEESES